MHFTTGLYARHGRMLMVSCAIACSLLLASCGSGGDRGKEHKKPPEVGYIVPSPTTLPVTVELPARTSAYRNAEVRPQISGVVQRRLFAEGAYVRAGQPLYQIDASLYRAAVDQAAANVTSAQAAAEAARAKADRYKPLAAAQAVSQQDYTDAAAAARQTAAAVSQQRAALNTARINLRFTTVPAPISGRIGRSLVTEGALVTGNQTTPLAVISALDPIYVDIQQSSTDMLKLRRALASGGAQAMSTPVRLKLEDGSTYGYSGKVEFSEVVVDPATGTVTLRARFPNPDGLLLPGMFVRASFAQASQSNAYLVPQAALSRDAGGTAQVYIVGPGDKAVVRPVEAAGTLGSNWIVTAGLTGREKVITQGLGKLKPGQRVKPVPASTPQKVHTKKTAMRDDRAAPGAARTQRAA